MYAPACIQLFQNLGSSIGVSDCCIDKACIPKQQKEEHSAAFKLTVNLLIALLTKYKPKWLGPQTHTYIHKIFHRAQKKYPHQKCFSTA